MNVAFALDAPFAIPQITVPTFRLPVSLIVLPATVAFVLVNITFPVPVYVNAGIVAVAAPVIRKVMAPAPLIVLPEPKLKNAPSVDLIITSDDPLFVNVALPPIVTFVVAVAVVTVSAALLVLVTLAPAPRVIDRKYADFEIDIVIPVVPFIVKAQADDVKVPTPEAIDNVALAPFIVKPLPRFSVPVCANLQSPPRVNTREAIDQLPE